jgi:hypothetical protein
VRLLLPGLLALLRLLARQLLQLASQFFGLASQLLLLPSLSVGHLLLMAVLLRQLFLPFRQLLQLGHGRVQFLVGGTGVLRQFLLRLVLVLRQVHFEFIQLRNVAAGARRAPAAAILLSRNLNIAERRFGAQQHLQRGLFVGYGLQ